MIWVCLPILQTLTSPSMPPETIFWQSLVPEMAERSFPDCGRKDLILPSFHPERIDLPSLAKKTQWHSSPGTSILRSSCLVLVFQTLMSFRLLVANNSE